MKRIDIMERYKKNKRYWIMCDCLTHALCVQREDEDLIDIAFWQKSFCYEQMSLRERIKTAFRVLCKKDLYADMVILNKKEKNKLIKVLQKI